MNTSENTNQIHDTAKITARTAPGGFRRRTMAGALVIMAFGATAVGFAATAHADDSAPGPTIEAPAIQAPVPAPVAPWVPTFQRWAGNYWPGHLQCGFPGWRGPFQCWYG
ncbi:hypothetical protein A5730_09690 [Mycobacterium sp. ACS4054]|uniref:hypothetical protein n=1 Tax=Mycobacterium sp. ACS4054 TaxID=1834119 RepID=UPI0008012FA8|nr:hypothetical protein [Mycobacterium sp. ACS4054]OBF08013.1 hypothetical protein A5730_09690 [Mycobacterium sp. ACS4054]